MIKLKVYILILSLFSLTANSFGQTKKSEQELVKYFKQLKSSKVDTVLTLKSGCTGCETTYTDTPKSVIDGQTIYVLTQKNGQFKLAIFDDIHIPRYYVGDTCSLFDMIDQSKPVLKSKDTFYKKELAELKKVKFLPPRPIHYPFEELVISLPNFHYDFVINNKDADYLGFVRENEQWFKATKYIIDKFYNYIKTLKG